MYHLDYKEAPILQRTLIGHCIFVNITPSTAASVVGKSGNTNSGDSYFIKQSTSACTEGVWKKEID